MSTAANSVSTILDLGATGNVGGQVAEHLLDAGVAIRVGVRSPEKAMALAARGAQVVAFDFDVRGSWDAALEGIAGVFIVSPSVRFLAEPVRPATWGGPRRTLVRHHLGQRPAPHRRPTFAGPARPRRGRRRRGRTQVRPLAAARAVGPLRCGGAAHDRATPGA